jgi:SAM-dependent methyltransferase
VLLLNLLNLLTVLLAAAGVGFVLWWLLRKPIRYYWAKTALALPRTSPYLTAVRKFNTPPPGPPTLRPYESLAALWHELAEAIRPDYPAFLRALARRHSRPFDAVLDLGCGTGGLTVKLAQEYRRVVGLDASPEMLGRAREVCAGLENVRLVEGDFRSFELTERFDVAVCAADSLNYLTQSGEMEEVFRAVGRHLSPGGFFVFDAICGTYYRLTTGLTVFMQVGERGCELRHDYDPTTGIDSSAVYFDNGVELHRRRAIEPAQVRAAARETGFDVADAFSTDGYRFFYVLRKKGP